MLRKLIDLVGKQTVYRTLGDENPLVEVSLVAESAHSLVAYAQWSESVHACVKVDPQDGRGERWFHAFQIIGLHDLSELREPLAALADAPGLTGLENQRIYYFQSSSDISVLTQKTVYPARPGDRVAYFPWADWNIEVVALVYCPGLGERWFQVFTMPIPKSRDCIAFMERIQALSPPFHLWQEALCGL